MRNHVKLRAKKPPDEREETEQQPMRDKEPPDKEEDAFSDAVDVLTLSEAESMVTDPVLIQRRKELKHVPPFEGPRVRLPTALGVGSGAVHQETCPARTTLAVEGDTSWRTLSAVMDSGAGLSMIDKALAESIQSKAPQLREIKISGIGTSKSKGFHTLKVTIPAVWKGKRCRLEMEHEFHVVDELGCGLLIGNDILTHHGIVLDMGRGCGELPSKARFALSGRRRDEPLALLATKDIVIPRGQHAWVTGRWNKTCKGGIVVTEATLTGCAAIDAWYIVPRMIIRQQLNKVLVTNVGDNDVFLSSDAPIATATALSSKTSKAVGEVLWSETNVERINDATALNTGADTRPFDVRDNPDHHEPGTRHEGTELVDNIFDVGRDAQGQPHRKIVEVLREHRQAFSLDGKPGHVSYEPMKIPVPDTSHLRAQPPRRISPEKKAIVDDTIRQSLEMGIIQPSTSSVSSPLVLVKQGPKWRMCVDYRAVNDATTPDRYPLQRMDDVFEAVGGATMFSALDAVKGYHQLDVDPADRYKTAFSCHRGLYEYTRVPFGLKNAPAFFQRFMDKLLGSMRYDTAMVYLDDVVVYTVGLESHIRALRDLLRRAISVGLKFDPKKCHFALPSLKLLGRKISAAGVSVLEDRAKLIKLLAPPKNYKDLDAVCGLFGFYRFFVSRFSEKIFPLRRHLKKWRYKATKGAGKSKVLVRQEKGGRTTETVATAVKIPWGEEEDKAFEQLKSELHDAVTLAFPNFNLRFFLYVDTSKDFMAAAIHQQFLYRLTDNDDSEANLSDLAWPHDDLALAKIKKGQSEDPLWSKFVRDLGEGKPVAGYRLQEGILVRTADDCICLPKDYVLQCLTEGHKGHPGFSRTFSAVAAQYCHPRLAELVRSFVKHCPECIRVKTPKRSGRLEIRSDDVAYPFHTVSLDLLLGLPKVGDFDACLILTDTFTKTTMFEPTSKKVKSEEITKMFEELVLRRGFKPSRIITDRENRLMKGVGQALSERLGAKLEPPPAYHHQAVPAERFVQTAKTALRALVVENDGGIHSWPDLIPSLELSLNSIPYTTTGYAPFDLLYSNHPRLLNRLTEHYGTGSLAEKLNFSKARCDQAVDAVMKAREEHKRRYDKRRQTLPNLVVGDEVLIRLHDRPLRSGRQGNTLEPPLEGPFKVKEILSDHRVRLDLCTRE